VIVGDFKKERLALAKKFGCETIDLSTISSLPEAIAQIIGVPEVDSAIDCVGFEAKQDTKTEQGSAALNTMILATRSGGTVGLVGLYVPMDPGSKDPYAREGILGVRMGWSWIKGLSYNMGQTPVMRYHRQLMNCILHNKIEIAKAVNVTVVSLDDAPKAYQDFDNGAPKKFVIDPHGMIK